MTWRKYFKVANTGSTTGKMSPISGRENFAFRNFQSTLPEVYSGHPNRVERYNQYEAMDMDSEVNACLDIIAEFSTQENEQNKTPFSVEFNEKPTDNEVKIIDQNLRQWCKLNKFSQRMFKIFRNTLKYGDQVFLRDPETFELFWVEPNKLSRVIVNESKGKEPEQYLIMDINPNFENLTVASKTTSDFQTNPPSGQGGYSAPLNYTVPNNVEGGHNGRFNNSPAEVAVEAQHIIHLSLTEGLDYFWPFGQSILEQIFKVYKQKELLEDSILIYRVQRAPERRLFKIDTGNMPSHLAMSFVERIKNEIHQRRIPTADGGGSNLLDASYNPLCLDLETQIPLLDGRTLSLNEIIDEFNNGKENWIYSCNPETGEIVPGVVNWAGITRKNTEVIKLTLDNGEEVICTPDHKIPVFGKGFVEAQDLLETDSLISYNTRNKQISTNSSDYQQVWDHKAKDWKWTHRLVGEFFREQSENQEFTYLDENIDKEKTVIHHSDYNRFNNNPNNLTYMNKKDHFIYHSATKKEWWKQLSEENYNEISSKISNTLKNNWKNLTKKDKEISLCNIKKAQKKSVYMRQHDFDTKISYKKAMRKSRLIYFKNNPKALEQSNKNLESRIKIKNQEIILTFNMLQIIVDIVKTGTINKNKVISLCNKNKPLLKLVKDANPYKDNGYKNFHSKIDFTKFGYSKLNRLITQYNYKNWKTFVKEVNNFNHKVIKIEKISNRNVGTITVDGNEKWHNFHTFALSSGVFVKNSTNEDYFFPMTADGRGSSVEILKGGDNLGEIDDLKYFNNKMARGLRVPSSYLPTGPDDSDRSISDGRVGTALIQEFRFNKYCERLQSLLVTKLNEEFKLFLSWRGYNIDAGMYDIKFNEPQNFASYRQVELDGARLGNYGSVSEIPYMSKRFALKRFLGLTEEEMRENEELWREENAPDESIDVKGNDMRGVGVGPGDFNADMDNMDDFDADMGDVDMGDAEVGAPEAGGNDAPEV